MFIPHFHTVIEVIYKNIIRPLKSVKMEIIPPDINEDKNGGMSLNPKNHPIEVIAEDPAWGNLSYIYDIFLQLVRNE